MSVLWQRGLAVALIVLSLAWLTRADAAVFYGEYDGFISRQVSQGMEDPAVVGRPTTGNFFFDTSFFTLGAVTATTATYSYNNLQTHENSLWIGRDGYANIPDLGAHTIRLERVGGKDVLYFSSYGPGGGYGRSIRLVGDEGSFFDQLDLDLLHSGPIDLTQSRAYSGTYREDEFGPSTFISFNSASFQAVALPEPSSIAMCAMALALVTGMRKRPI